MPIHAQRSIFRSKTWSLFTLLVLILSAACTPAGALLPDTGQPSANSAQSPPGKPVAPVEPVAPRSNAAEAEADAPEADAPEADAPETAVAKPDLKDLALLIGSDPGSPTLHMRRIDLRSGKPPAGEEPLEVGTEMNYAFSPDRASLALTAKGAGCQGTCLRIYRLADLQETARVALPEISGINDYVHQLTFDPQAERIALAYTRQGRARLAVVDLVQPAPGSNQDAPGLAQEVDLAFSARLTAFTADGTQIMLFGAALPDRGVSLPGELPQPQVLLLDARTLEVLWRQDLPDLKDGFYGSADHSKLEESFYYMAGAAADPARQRIYLAHADADRLTTVDFKAQSLTTVEIHDPQTSLERLFEFVLSLGVRPVQAKAGSSYTRQALLSADGASLYVVGDSTILVSQPDEDWQVVRTPYGLQRWKIESGTRQLQLETEASEIRPAPGGMLLLNGYASNTPENLPFTEIFDPASGQIFARLENTSAFRTLRLNGDPALVSVVSEYLLERAETTLSILNAKSHEVQVSWTQESGYSFWPELR